MNLLTVHFWIWNFNQNVIKDTCPYLVFGVKCVIRVHLLHLKIFRIKINGSLAIGNNIFFLKLFSICINYLYYKGIGHTQLSELSASIELPSLSTVSYLKNLSVMSNSIQETAFDEMIKAGNEERQIAINSGNVDKNGTPLCTVVADGQWSKRSYKTKYNSFSGAVRTNSFYFVVSIIIYYHN